MIVDILSEDLIIPNLRSQTRDDVLAELVDRISAANPAVDRTYALRCLVDRERIASTGIGNGIAIPHAKIPGLKKAIACFARSQDGVDFRSLDGQPAHLFLTLLAPEGATHLKALARASRLLKDDKLREKLLESENASSIYGVIYETDKRLAAG